MGLKIAVLSSSVALGGLLGMDSVLRAIKKDGSVFPYLPAQERLSEMEDLYMLRGSSEIQDWDARFMPGAARKA
jgi:hypothetical protein